MPVSDSTWKKDQGKAFIGQTSVSHKVGDLDLAFYPISASLTFKLRGLAKPLGELLATIFASTKDDNGTVNESVQKGQDGIEGYNKFIAQPTTAETIKLRHELLTNSVQQFLDAIMADSMQLLLAELVMDSLRDYFPRKDPGNPSIEEFSKTLDLVPMIESLIGVAKANKGVFGPLVRTMGGQDLTARLGNKLKEAVDKIAV